METQTLESTNMDVKEVTKENSSEQLVERWPIPNSPFTVITLEGKEHFGVMGEYRMTESYESRGECEDELKCITWNRIIQVMMVLDEIKGKDKTFKEKVEESLKTNK